MATLRKRSPRQWQAQVRRLGYLLQSKTFDTRAAADQWARSSTSSITDYSLHEQRPSPRRWLQRYLAEVTPQKKGAGPETSRIKTLLKHPLARRFVATVRGVDIALYRDERLRKVSPATATRDIVVISHLFEVARKEWGIQVRNPVRDVKLPPHNRPRDRRLCSADGGNESEEQRLLAACRDARNPFLLPVVQLALETAMRQGELVRIRWEHVELNRRTVHLPDTKNGDARTVPLSTTAIKVLRTLPGSLHGQVFPGLTTEAIKRAFIRTVRRAGIKDLRFHDLRHEATTRLFERGLNIMEVASITGHKDLRMLRRYTHLKAEDLARKLG